MSRFRSAVNKAVEVGNKNKLTRTVKNYADSVVQQAGHAVVEGAKILQDRIELGSLSWWSDAGGGRWWSEAGGGRYVVERRRWSPVVERSRWWPVVERRRLAGGSVL
nr:coiled-coil domain-containing protein 18-like [Ipomoea batatas]